MNSSAQIKAYELFQKHFIQPDNGMSGRSIWKSKGQITISNDGYTTSRSIAAGGGGALPWEPLKKIPVIIRMPRMREPKLTTSYEEEISALLLVI